jgi:hypothetical protein
MQYPNYNGSSWSWDHTKESLKIFSVAFYEQWINEQLRLINLLYSLI